MRSLWLALLMFLATIVAGCEVIGDIFQAGFAVGAVMVILVVAGIAFLVMKFKG
jgi:hypothetical protein